MSCVQRTAEHMHVTVRTNIVFYKPRSINYCPANSANALNHYWSLPWRRSATGWPTVCVWSLPLWSRISRECICAKVTQVVTFLLVSPSIALNVYRKIPRVLTVRLYGDESSASRFVHLYRRGNRLQYPVGPLSESWVRIPLETWMSVCIIPLCGVLCI
jgi:hypothetical protein